MINYSYNGKKCISCSKEITRYAIRCHSCATKKQYKLGLLNNTGKNNSFYGKHHTEESKEKRRKKMEGTQTGENNPFYGRKHTKETLIKMSQRLTGRIMSEKARQNQSLGHGGTGIPYENIAYSKEFYELRDSIRERDNYECQICDMTEEEQLIVLGYELSVHHIDYDTQNNDKDNLITLCLHCHLRTNYNRKYWIDYFKEIQND